jgi:hypothetical protein
MEQQMMRQLKSPKRKSIDPNELNIGTRLYQKGIKKIEERERYIKQVKEIHEKLEFEALDFKP